MPNNTLIFSEMLMSLHKTGDVKKKSGPGLMLKLGDAANADLNFLKETSGRSKSHILRALVIEAAKQQREMMSSKD